MSFQVPIDVLELTFLLGIIVWTGANIVYPYVSEQCRMYFLKHMTTVDDLPLLGLQRNKKIKGTAVICGGRYASGILSSFVRTCSITLRTMYSISGLLAARVCADHFTDVLVIDPEMAEIQRTKPSARIPQYDSLHGEFSCDPGHCCSINIILGYLAIVFDGMRRLFPNFESEVREAGGMYEFILLLKVYS